MSMTFDERLEMLQQASRSWLELRRTIDRIPEQAMKRPNTIGSWSGCDLLAHLANWEEVAIDVIEEIEAGGDEFWPEADADQINAELLEPYRDCTLYEALEYLETTHFQLMEVAERAGLITPSAVLGVTAEHYAQHMGDLQSLADAGH